MLHAFGVTKTIIFDLDDTLYDCSGTLIHSMRLKVAGVIASAIGCSEKEAYELQLKKETTLNGNLYEDIAQHYSLPPSFLEDIKKALSEVSINEIRPFEGVVDVLKYLKNKGLVLYLVTAGIREEQEGKIHVLGLDGMFDEIIILQAVSSEAKKACFKEILDKHDLKPEEVLCVGDRMDRELKVAKELGIPTVMVKHGRHYQRFVSGSKGGEKPDIYIESVADLPSVLPVK
ncbi:MAG: HAD family hydrolase [Candidatus Brocadiales bacterium]